MTSGEELKQLLGLEKFKYVRIGRALISSLKVFFICFDSLRPQVPITSYKIKKFPWTAMIFRGDDLKHGSNNASVFAPFVDIESFNGILENGIYITVDLAGQLAKASSFSRVLKANRITKIGKLKEFVTMSDLMDTRNISSFTKDFRQDRTSILGGENTTAKLIDVFLNRIDDSITFVFQTEATSFKKDVNLKRPPVTRYKRPKKRTQPLNLSLISNPEKKYEIQIKILEFFSWLEAQKEGIDSLTEKHIKEILEISNIQLFSSSPSYQYQGFNFWLSQIDGSIYPTAIAPQVWNNIHGDGDAFLDKHLYGLIRQMKFFYNPMASMLTKRLKDEGYI